MRPMTGVHMRLKAIAVAAGSLQGTGESFRLVIVDTSTFPWVAAEVLPPTFEVLAIVPMDRFKKPEPVDFVTVCRRTENE